MAIKHLNNKKLPPITKGLSGLTKFKTQKTDKEMLLTALEKKYLQESKYNYQKYKKQK